MAQELIVTPVFATVLWITMYATKSRLYFLTSVYSPKVKMEAVFGYISSDKNPGLCDALIFVCLGKLYCCPQCL